MNQAGFAKNRGVLIIGLAMVISLIFKHWIRNMCKIVADIDIHILVSIVVPLHPCLHVYAQDFNL